MDEHSSRTTLLLFTEWLLPLKNLTLEDAGRVFLALLQYQSDGTIPELSQTAKIAFDFILPAIERNNAKYEETLSKRRKSGSLGGKTRARHAKEKAQENSAKEAEANASNYIITQAYQDVPDSDRDPDRDLEPNPEPLSAIDGERDREKEFAILAEAYPRHEAIVAARAEYEAVDADLDVLLCAIEAQKQSDQWQRDGGRYIPHLSRWLAEKRWEDHCQHSPRGYIKHDDPPTPNMVCEIKRMLQESD